MPRGRPKSGTKKDPLDSRSRNLREMRGYIEKNPDCTFEEMKKGLALKGLAKPWFLVIKGEVLRKQSGVFVKSPSSLGQKSNGYMKVQILDTLDISGLSADLIAHYRSHILPLLKRVHPDGPMIHFAFLSDPPSIEIRKMVG